jgi:ribosome maturation factor RimP
VSPVQAAIERTVIGMGYELVDVEFAGGGLLRVYIDLPASAYAADAPLAADGLPPSVRVEDCERVSHQLSHVLTVENIDYARLEVSSPGMDRPLRRAADFERFVGHEVSVRLRQPLSGRRNFSGVLVHDDASSAGGDAASPGQWVLELSDAAPSRAAAGKGRAGAGKSGGGAKGPAAPKSAKPGGRSGRTGDTHEQEAAAAAATDTPQQDAGVETVRRLTFTLDEIERARLVPRYKF